MLTDLSNQLADVVAASAAAVVQVQGRRRPASGLVYGADVAITTMRVLGREDGIRVRRDDGETFDAELAGWDPTTNLAAVRAPGLGGQPLALAAALPRVGHLAVAVGRSWSNAVTASAGIVAVIGGPLPTGRRRAIDQVIRTTAPMHEGFAGGALLDTAGGLTGVATGAEIRGLGVVIPASLAWKAIAAVLEHGGMRRGYLGLAGQTVRLAAAQREAIGGDRETGLLVVGVSTDGPAARAGVLVGDVIASFDGAPVDSPEEVFDLLAGSRAGRAVAVRMLRGHAARDVTVVVGERPRDSTR